MIKTCVCKFHVYPLQLSGGSFHYTVLDEAMLIVEAVRAMRCSTNDGEEGRGRTPFRVGVSLEVRKGVSPRLFIHGNCQFTIRFYIKRPIW